MKIAIASDHRGVEYKKQIIEYLNSKNYTIIDCSEETLQQTIILILLLRYVEK